MRFCKNSDYLLLSWIISKRFNRTLHFPHGPHSIAKYSQQEIRNKYYSNGNNLSEKDFEIDIDKKTDFEIIDKKPYMKIFETMMLKTTNKKNERVKLKITAQYKKLIGINMEEELLKSKLNTLLNEENKNGRDFVTIARHEIKSQNNKLQSNPKAKLKKEKQNDDQKSKMSHKEEFELKTNSTKKLGKTNQQEGNKMKPVQNIIKNTKENEEKINQQQNITNTVKEKEVKRQKIEVSKNELQDEKQTKLSNQMGLPLNKKPKKTNLEILEPTRKNQPNPTILNKDKITETKTKNGKGKLEGQKNIDNTENSNKEKIRAFLSVPLQVEINEDELRKLQIKMTEIFNYLNAHPTNKEKVEQNKYEEFKHPYIKIIRKIENENPPMCIFEVVKTAERKYYLNKKHNDHSSRDTVKKGNLNNAEAIREPDDKKINTATVKNNPARQRIPIVPIKSAKKSLEKDTQESSLLNKMWLDLKGWWL